ncbi:MAG: CusA/CzcA family heavy metal efflux RND transporter [Pedosphaera sp. Tous-C6FEB]|nr:MAG: CusA/CzcA family heavy metal efflux RND transporter [Pedosphaera sp. Tous-C6FEB]
MMDKLIRWSLESRALVFVASALLLVFGALTAVRMPVDVFPDLTAPTVTVMTEAHGMAPAEVEQQVTLPIETALNGAADVRRIRSQTVVGLSVVWVEFNWGTDVRAARQVVTERLTTVENSLPPEVSRPQLAPASSIMGEIMFVGLTSDQHSPLDLHAYAETRVRRRLLSVPGVSHVAPIGGAEKQFQVVLDPARLLAYGVSLEQVLRAVEAGNENVSAGVVNERGSEWLVTGEGRVRSADDLRALVVTATNGVPVTIAELGDARIGPAPVRGEASLKGQPGVILALQKQPAANTLELTRHLDAALDALTAELPTGMKLHRDLFRQATFIQTAVSNVERALVEGIALVVLVVMLFLANVRATLISVVAIPLSLVAAVLTLKAFGATINTMTLGGMAIAIGALVDDAVIDVENVFRRLREWATARAGDLQSPSGALGVTTTRKLPDATDGDCKSSARPTAFQVVLAASTEIRGSIVFATLIIALAFVPVFFLTGVEGRLLQPLGVAYLVALLASLLVAVTLTPALCLALLPASRAVQAGHETRLAAWLKTAYTRALAPALRHPWMVTLPAVLLLAAAIASLALAGRAFLPDFNEGALTINAVTLPGTSLAESDKLARLVEATIREHPEVTSTARRTGRGELDEHGQGVEATELEVTLKLGARNKEAFLAALRADLALVPGMNITIGQPISHRIDHMLSGTRASVAVKLFGPDLARLRELGARARDAMQTVPGVVDLNLEPQMEVPVLRVVFDRSALARHGLTIREVARHLEAAVTGVTVSRVLAGPTAYDLVVKVEAGERAAASVPLSPIGGEGQGEGAGVLPKVASNISAAAPSPQPSPPVGEREKSALPARVDDLQSPAPRLDDFASILVDTPAGARVPLGSLARIVKDAGPNAISRESVERKIVISCNTAGRDVTAVVGDARARLAPLLAVAPGYRVEFGGQFEAAEEANRVLALVGCAVVAGMLFLLQQAFGSWRDAWLIMLNLPLALIGGAAGVWLSGGVLSVASVIGFITVFGIATRNGIMLVSHIRHLQEHEGIADFTEAVARGARERLVPILMTALAAGLALVPLALSGDQPGNEIQKPMAIVILGGLLTSMFLNMLVVPALYLRFGRPAKGETQP